MIKPRYRTDTGFIDPKTLPCDENGNRMCRYCNDTIKPPKRTFCSKRCVHEYRIRSDGAYLRQCVFMRDNGVCSMCGIDTKQTAELLRCVDPTSELYNDVLKRHDITKKRKITNYMGGGLWDADHIIPVKDGGGQCGLENIRTLCISCHKKVTYNRF